MDSTFSVNYLLIFLGEIKDNLFTLFADVDRAVAFPRVGFCFALFFFVFNYFLLEYSCFTMLC